MLMISKSLVRITDEPAEPNTISVTDGIFSISIVPALISAGNETFVTPGKFLAHKREGKKG
jgi:hypothetical protein